MAGLEVVLKDTISLVSETANFISAESKSFDLDKIELKSFNNLVSYVDKTSERLLIEGLSKIVPGCGILAEESHEASFRAEYTWIIDPLDGTTNFVHSLPVFAISVALMHNEEIVLGVVHEVNSDDCYSAILGQGAFCNNRKIKVSEVEQLNQSLIATGFPYDNFDQLESYFKILKDFMTRTHGIRRLGSAAVDLCYVANGTFEGFFEYNLNSWDVAAGALIVKEAGGTVTDFSNSDKFISDRQIIAAGPVHSEMIKVINKHWR